jgi:Lrp/AsnC family transcriptional regulator of ectoine degradation
MTRPALDAVDISILCALQEHGPLSKTALAARVNLSPTPCWTRLGRLKRAGLIRGYHAEVALERVADVSKVVVALSLTHHRQTDFARFENRIRELDDVVECIATGGGTDYVLTFMCPGLSEFQNLMEQLLTEDLGIGRYVIYIATKQVKSARPNIPRLVGLGPG